ncbi:LysR substrate-binding domain-containing protein [Azonexus sp. R2A61]|uniref:LysR substrate-binding domain-containing protein n=1 Tax=Azonexus sp. R2A61 TaxID=2744443 RepID=UPI001F21BCAC|nr:LysR substrate-binding domain-containing protein [Azonexus sp. R2A61]
MEFRQLKYFIAVAEELNIGRAAARLHISQPPLTRQIQQLEEEFDTQLFLRTPRGVELTQAGEMFLRDARNIRDLMLQSIERVREAGQGKRGKLDIGIFGSGILDVIPKVLHAFRATHPDVQIALHQMNKNEQIEALRQRRIMAGFNRMLAPLPDISSEPVMLESIMVAVNEKHPLAAKPAILLKELAGQPLILFPGGSRPSFIDKVWALCAGEGFEPKVAQEVGDAPTSVALVAAGFGLSLVPEAASSLSVPGVAYRRLANAPDAVVDLSCIYRTDEDSPLLLGFLQTIREFREKTAARP